MSSERVYRPTWAEVRLDAIRENARALAELGKRKGVELIGVVKADGYGHGAVASAKAALEGGVKALAVALVEEGIELRRAGIAAPILVMGAYVPGTAAAYSEYGLEATVSDFEQLRFLAAAAELGHSPVMVHLKVDTGMGRLGVLPGEAVALAEEAARSQGVELRGVYSHLATADEEEGAYARTQIALFEQVLECLRSRGIEPPVRHVLNTGGLLQHSAGSTNFARVGLGLYGLYPSEHLRKYVKLRPALSWKCRVAAVKRVPAGTPVSYGRTYVTAKETGLATIPVGYADGFSRRLSGKVSVLIGGRRFPVVGRICMDQAVVDIDDAPVAPGDEVTLLGRQGEEEIPAEEWAAALESINYEVVCAISPRVPRLFVDER